MRLKLRSVVIAVAMGSALLGAAPGLRAATIAVPSTGNSLDSVTSAPTSPPVEPAFPPASQSAGAVVLVNSRSASYLDFHHFIQPYLDNFGFPYTVLDVATNALDQSISNCAVIIIGHSQLDTDHTCLSAAAQANLSLAVAKGTGLVNFDNDLSAAGAPRYQFVQDIFGFSYGSGASDTSVSLPPTESSSQMHYITARHPKRDVVAFRSSLSLAGIQPPRTATVLARVGGQPLMTIAKYGQGRAVQWSSYDWMVSTVLGPVGGLDDVLWRGVVWAARKPFVMRGMPNFVTMRVDDASGPFGWVHTANAVGFKPFLALFYLLVSEWSAAELQTLITNGLATTSIHSTDSGNSFFYFDHATEQPWPDNVQSNNFYLGTQWHLAHGIPISRICATHYSEIGLNCFAGLKAWGMEYVPIEVVPGTADYVTPGAPWLVGGPFRLYETPQAGAILWPTYYADWLTVPGHPEFDRQFFNIYSEVRDVGTCGEWCPDNDVAGSVSRATQMAKRALDSHVMTTLYTHEWYISPVSAAKWQAILQGITNNLASYNPTYVTLDYASQYVRATKTSRLLSSAFDAASGLLTANFSGRTDLDTQVYIFAGADDAVTSSFGMVPTFSLPSPTTLPITGPQALAPPAIISEPVSLTTNAGATASFAAAVVGTGPLSYQWLKNSAPLANGGNIAGASGPTLTLTGVCGTNAGEYEVVVTNLAGSATGAIANLVVVLPPQFTSVTLLPYGYPSFSVSAGASLSYCVDASTDLVNWTPLTNLPNPSGTFQFVDLDATNYSRRFYRAVWAP